MGRALTTTKLGHCMNNLSYTVVLMLMMLKLIRGCTWTAKHGFEKTNGF